MTALTAVLDRIDADLPEALDRLVDLLKIQSISTDPAYATECQKAADWLVKDLVDLGFDAAARPTPGHPIVVAHYTPKHAAEGPHLLFYGHYDVQPADPLELWETSPFEPFFAEDEAGNRRIVARGSSDDKGQLMTFVEACRGWIRETGDLPTRVTILLEGEEETGGENLAPFLKANAEELKAADIAAICDTGMWDRNTPAITTMLRGMVYEEVTITAADMDLHSGMFGGASRNAIRVLTKLMAGLHDDDGKVTLPGFYDDVPELPADIKVQWDGLDVDPAAFLGKLGLSELAGEKGRSLMEQIWSRPTCDVNGISGGYTGEGSKTVIAAQAMAKVSFRLVGQQDPEIISRSFRQYIIDNLPVDCTASFKAFASNPAVVLPYDSREMQAARDALNDEWQTPAVMTGCGGSIPVAGDFQEILGMDSLMIGFALDDDRIHSPNEKYELSSFHKGTRSWARLLGKFGDMGA